MMLVYGVTAAHGKSMRIGNVTVYVLKSLILIGGLTGWMTECNDYNSSNKN